jgi:hypothetical protein
MAFASTMTPHYEAPGVEGIGPTGIEILCGSSTTCDVRNESVDQLTTQTLLGSVATFGGGITGKFTGDGQILPADQYGDTHATGNYLGLSDGQAETLTLNPPVNLFGLWFSALDATSTLMFYQTGDPDAIYTIGGNEFQALVVSSPDTEYCGNPNPTSPDADDDRRFTYLALLDTSSNVK